MDAASNLPSAVQTLQDLENLHEDLIRRLDELETRILKVIAEFQPGEKSRIETVVTRFPGINTDPSAEELRRVA